jgi:hypothetical protein
MFEAMILISGNPSLELRSLGRLRSVQAPDRGRLYAEDGIWRDAGFPARFPLELREFQWPGAYIQSRWDGNGKPKEATAISGFCNRGGRRRRLIAAAKELFDLPFQIRKRAVG